ncbi:MAG TPA: hypothetical protein VFG69_09045, partial [Nannocystaceae bacterium]|nr:hypothetical protein [Nannocystaceae bacterium]
APSILPRATGPESDMRTHHPARGGTFPASLFLTLTAASLCGCPADDDDDDGANDDGSTSGASTGAEDSTSGDGSTSGDDSTSGDATGTDTAACVDEAGEAGLPEDALEIEGDWADDFMGMHAITSQTWTQTFGEDSFTYTIVTYDNATDTMIAQDDGDSTWSKFQWTETTDGLYYCQVAFALTCRADAEATPDADPADPIAGGCGMFPWTHLAPA